MTKGLRGAAAVRRLGAAGLIAWGIADLYSAAHAAIAVGLLLLMLDVPRKRQ